MGEMRNAQNTDLEKLIKTKIDTILNNENSIPETEIKKIETYVKKETKKRLSEYKIIIDNKQEIGVLLVYPYKDGVLIDEIYITESFRNKGIGRNLLTEIIKNNKKSYLWVYKSNVGAVKLYKELNFKIVEATETRYFMLNENEVGV